MNALYLGLALTVGAPALKDKEAPPSLVGEWVIEQVTVGGRPDPPGDRPNRWVFRKDGTRSILSADGQPVNDGGYAADPKAGTVDLSSKDFGPHLCRYKIEGDTLTLAVGWPDKDRPAELASAVGSKCTLYVMKRVKAKD